LVETSPWLLLFRRRLSEQPLEQRIATFEAMENHSIYLLRTAFYSLRTLMLIGYMADIRVQQTIGVVPNLSPFAQG
jgi:hypothetical protein